MSPVLMGRFPGFSKGPLHLLGYNVFTKEIRRLWGEELDIVNQASIAKLVWAVATKKDNLWVKWVHGKYLKT